LSKKIVIFEQKKAGALLAPAKGFTQNKEEFR
jgi:hypothetical protein